MPLPPILQNVVEGVDVESISGFGQVTWDITDKLELPGVRESLTKGGIRPNIMRLPRRYRWDTHRFSPLISVPLIHLQSYPDL